MESGHFFFLVDYVKSAVPSKISFSISCNWLALDEKRVIFFFEANNIMDALFV